MPATSSVNALQDCQPINNKRMVNKMMGSSLKQLQTFAIGIINQIDCVREEFLLETISTMGNDNPGKLLILKYIEDQADSVKTAWQIFTLTTLLQDLKLSRYSEPSFCSEFVQITTHF